MWMNLALNVIGGILVGLAFSFWHSAVREYTKRRFR